MTPSDEPLDVESYAQARWVDLTEVLLDLGASDEEARAAAVSALASVWNSRRRWEREQRSGDVDELVVGALLSAWGWPAQRPDVADDRVARALVARGRVAEWTAERLTGADPGDVPLAPWPPEDRTARRAAPVAAIREEAGRLRVRRRRTTTRVAAGGLVAAAVVGVLVAVTGSRDDEPVRPVVANPLPIAWWSEGTLHLGRSEVDVAGVVSMAQAGSGSSYAVVLGDENGTILEVDEEGEPTRIGQGPPGASIAASPEGRAAWVEGGGAQAAVVVFDIAADEELGRLPLDVSTGSRTEVVALDGDTAWLRSPAGTSRWVLGEAAAEPVLDRVVDAAGGALLVTVAPSGTTLTPPAAQEEGTRFEVGADLRAVLSPGGLVAAAWTPDEPTLALAGAGPNLSTVPLDLPERDAVLEARFAPNGDLVLVLAHDPPGGQRWGGGPGEEPTSTTIATCVLQTGRCIEPVSLDDPAVLLAR